MSHPFTQILRKALSKSSKSLMRENLVLEEARALQKKGYRPEEIYLVLKKIRAGLIKDEDIEIMNEVLEEFGTYMDE